MLRRGLWSLDELDAAEAAESTAPPSTLTPSIPITSVDPNLAEALSFFNPLDLYWSDIGFLSITTPDYNRIS